MIRLRQWWNKVTGGETGSDRDFQEVLAVGQPRDEQTDDTKKQLRVLENQLFDWLFDTEDLSSQPVSSTGRLIIRSLMADWKNDKHRLGTIPRQPNALPQLLRLLNLPDAAREDIAEAIMQDPALTDSVLRVANSPYFRTLRPVDNVDQAVFVMGTEGVRNAVSAALMQPLMTSRNAAERSFADCSWQWGLQCARASELIAKRNGVDGGAFFLLGLLPALSHLLIYRDLDRRYRKLAMPTDMEPATAFVAIRALGWRACVNVADAWQLPPRYHAHILEALRPSPVTRHTPLNDGMILASATQLRSIGRTTLSDAELSPLVRLSESELSRIFIELSITGASER